MAENMSSATGPFAVILDIAKAIAAGGALETTLHAIAENVGVAMFAESTRLGSYHAASDEYIHEACWRLGGVTAQDRADIGHVFSLKEYPELRAELEIGAVTELRIDDANLGPNDRAFFERYGLKTTLEGPLVYGGSVIGLLVLGESRFVRRYTPSERALFAQLCDLAAIGINTARQARRLADTKLRLDDALARLAAYERDAAPAGEPILGA